VDRAAAAPDPGALPRGLDVARQALAAARADAAGRGRRPSSVPPAAWSPRTGSAAEDRRSGPGPDDRDPQELQGLVPRMLAQRGWQARAAVSDLLTSWAEFVGEDIAAHCRPESFTRGRLVVAADSTAWATQLRLLAPDLVARLNDRLAAMPGTSAEDGVRDLRVHGPDAPSWRKGARRVPGRGPRDTYG
jgi:predicted nucleic acid-binding Zn ribbon protein